MTLAATSTTTLSTSRALAWPAASNTRAAISARSGPIRGLRRPSAGHASRTRRQVWVSSIRRVSASMWLSAAAISAEITASSSSC
ncbi:hypothetical protein V1282_007279 [Nitrobacteraceae bacterium AZCC 2146]